jgi:hypothetical protein
MRRSPPIASERGARGRVLIVLVVLLALAAAGAWWYLAPQSLPGFVRRQLPASPKANPPLYQWRDAQGHVHVTDTPPPDRPYQTLRFDPNANVLPKGVAPSGQ